MKKSTEEGLQKCSVLWNEMLDTCEQHDLDPIEVLIGFFVYCEEELGVADEYRSLATIAHRLYRGEQIDSAAK